MCGIVGLFDNKDHVILPKVITMLESISCRGPDNASLSNGISSITSKTPEMLKIDELNVDNFVFGHIRLAITGDSSGVQPFQSCDGRFMVEHNGEIYNYKEIKSKLESSHNFVSNTDSEVIVHLLEYYSKEEEDADLISILKKTLTALDGIYAIAIKDTKTGKIILARDRIGVRQLYYSTDHNAFVFASEKKALWQINIKENIKNILPGHVVIFDQNTKKIEEINIHEPVFSPKKHFEYTTMQEAISAYEKVLLKSMKKRTQDIKRIGIVFSGGIDSVMVAKLAQQMVEEVVCYTAGIENSNDILFAKSISKELDFNLKINELHKNDVEKMVNNIVYAIEERNSGQVEVAIPVYAATKLAKKDGMRILLTGQGADELFGGYSWYPKIAHIEGYESLQRYMYDDLMLLYKETLEREDKITMAHSIEMREPFLDRDVIDVAHKIDMRLNITDKDDKFGKHVHRQLANKLGIPYDICYRIKDAAQHGSGVHSMLREIAIEKGYTEISPTYIENLANRERLGSSQRYGYKFEDQRNGKWMVDPNIQKYIDDVYKHIFK